MTSLCQGLGGSLTPPLCGDLSKSCICVVWGYGFPPFQDSYGTILQLIISLRADSCTSPSLQVTTPIYSVHRYHGWWSWGMLFLRYLRHVCGVDYWK